MGFAKERDLINGEIGEYFRKLDMEADDLHHMHSEEADDVQDKLYKYLEQLPDQLPADYFYEADYHKEYLNAKKMKIEELARMNNMLNEVQPVIHTADVDFVLDQTKLEDTRKNRWIAAYLMRSYDKYDAVICIETLKHNWDLKLQLVDYKDNVNKKEDTYHVFDVCFPQISATHAVFLFISKTFDIK